jgi:hypothetical protein
MLPSKLETCEALGAQVRPQGSFSVRAIPAQSAPTVE